MLATETQAARVRLWRRGPWQAACVALAWLAVAAPCAGQHLQNLRSEVREPPRAAAAAPPAGETTESQSSEDESGDRRRRKRRRRDGHHSHDDDCDDDSVFGELFGWLAIGAVTSPVWVPMGMTADHYEHQGYFPAYPYAMHYDGQVVMSYDLDTPRAPPAFPWMARIRGDFGHDLDDLSQTRLQAVLDTSRRWGVDGSITYHHESVAGGNDELLTGDANLIYRFAQSPSLQFRTGVGVNWLSDQQDAEAGFNFTYGADWFLGRPWVLSTELDWGTLGDAELFHFRSTIGAVLRGTEFYTGWDYFDVGDARTSQIIAGLGIWF